MRRSLGEITREVGRVERAAELYMRKGNVAMAERARQRLALIAGAR